MKLYELTTGIAFLCGNETRVKLKIMKGQDDRKKCQGMCQFKQNYKWRQGIGIQLSMDSANGERNVLFTEGWQ